MPTLMRFGSTSVRIYADDHNPPHFHIVGTDFRVTVRISDLQVIAGESTAKEIEKPLEWAKKTKNYWLSSGLNSTKGISNAKKAFASHFSG